MRRNERKIAVRLIESNAIHNARLVEYLANKYKERGIENGHPNQHRAL